MTEHSQECRHGIHCEIRYLDVRDEFVAKFVGGSRHAVKVSVLSLNVLGVQ